MPLTDEQLSTYEKQGYLCNLPVLSPEETSAVYNLYLRLQKALPPGQDISHVAQWEKVNDEVFALANHPAILRKVRSLIGNDFYIWDSYFFVKRSRQNIISQWHQDMRIWPMDWGKCTTVFLAISDCHKENGCLRVIPGSHHNQNIPHRNRLPERTAESYLFAQEIPEEEINEKEIAYVELKAGECSLHSEWLIHGSGPNLTDKERVAVAFRYASYDVGCNTNAWPNFSVIPLSGTDRFNKNITREIPTEFGVPSYKDLPHYRD
jgi:ectoine hydroxylase-related dioxygenase (phytanoyl-CoA dioxygenase family)